MDNVIDYDLVKGDTEEDLLIQVRMMLRSMKNKDTPLSWKPQGGVCIVYNEKGKVTGYHQAMVLVEEDEIGGTCYGRDSDIQNL